MKIPSAYLVTTTANGRKYYMAFLKYSDAVKYKNRYKAYGITGTIKKVDAKQYIRNYNK